MKVKNIVFFKFYGEKKDSKGNLIPMTQACIFYEDGTVKMKSYEDGIEACEKIAIERKIKTKDAFKEMINKEIVHVMSGADFERNFSNFTPFIKRNIIDDAIGEELNSIELTIPEKIAKKTEVVNKEASTALTDPSKFVMPSSVLAASHEEDKDADEKDEEEEIEEERLITPEEQKELDELKKKHAESEKVVVPLVRKTKKEDFEKKTEDNHDKDSNPEEEIEEKKDNTSKSAVVIPPIPVIGPEDVKKSKKRKMVRVADEFDDDFDDSYDDSLDEDIEEKFAVKATKKAEPKKKGFFARMKDKFKKSSLGVKLTAIGLAIALAFGGIYACNAKKTKEGEMLNSNIAATQVDDNNTRNVDETSTEAFSTSTEVTNSEFEGFTYSQLLEVTNNQTQKEAMQNAYKALNDFNIRFADAHVEADKDIKAALSFEEVMALQQAYNDYSKDEIRAIFNGTEINSWEMSNAFKDANLQLMGAHVIETRENPVDMSMLINSEEGKEYYQRYHEMFLRCKETTGDEQIAAVREFYSAVRNDFPITDAVRTEGIAHADSRGSIESYQLSVIPMINAAEMMYQNLPEDLTLTDEEVAYINDIGLCNRADEKFEKIETITLGSCKDDETNPTYEQYRDAIVSELVASNHYVIDDAHRDLSQLDAFQDAVNWHFEMDENGYFTGSVYYTTETHTETRTWTEKVTTTREETTRTEKPIPQEERDKIDQEIEEENERAREEGEREAEENRQDMQEEADRRADEVRDEVEQDAQDLQDKIEDANDQIDENNKDEDTTNDTPVNEDDFGDHNVDFDDEYSDENGNLDNSVENITTDPTGDQTDEDLPDPNVTGAEFDKQVVEYEEPVVEEHHEDPEPVVEEHHEDPEPVVEEHHEDPEPVVEEHHEDPAPVVEYEEPVSSSSKKSNEEMVEEYVEQQASQQDEDEDAKVLEK